MRFAILVLTVFCIVNIGSQKKLHAFQFEIKKPLTVLNYNVWNSFNHNKSYTQTIQWVNRLEPDIAGWQELVGWNEEKLKAAAVDWKHPYAAALKEGGYNIGLTSKYPIKVIERRTKDFHHGFLHCQTAGIDVIVCHLWPGKRREQIKEAVQIRDRVVELEKGGREVLLMGDFNAHAASDAIWLNQQKDLIQRRSVGDVKKNLNDRFIRDGKYTFDVMSVIQKAPVIDLVREEFDKSDERRVNAIAKLGSFPTKILPHANTSKKQKNFLERIDFIFATRGLAKKCNWANVRRDEVTNKFSDHYPVTAKFGVKQVDVYLLAGQSNMQGIGKLEKLDTNRLGEIPRIHFFTGRKFEDLMSSVKRRPRHGKANLDLRSDWGGSLSKSLRSNKCNEIAILKFHASGQPLHHGWDGNQWMGDAPFAAGAPEFLPRQRTWQPIPIVVEHYKSMHSVRFRKGIANLKRQEIRIRVAGFAWMQGEQDSKHTISADAYAVISEKIETQRDRRGLSITVNQSQWCLAKCYHTNLRFRDSLPEKRFACECRRQTKIPVTSTRSRAAK